nr:YraN family protein [Paracoccus saliphilus]
MTRLYLGRGATLLAQRWRGKAGEIDIIFREGPDVVFVEVKASTTHSDAAQSLQPRQMRRIAEAACEFCQRQGWDGSVPMRIDVALVNGQGRVELIPNAFGEM